MKASCVIRAFSCLLAFLTLFEISFAKDPSKISKPGCRFKPKENGKKKGKSFEVDMTDFNPLKCVRGGSEAQITKADIEVSCIPGQ